MRLTIVALALLAAILAVPAIAADDGHPLKGVALVIGESDYATLHSLDNPKRDARAMDDMLDSLGFSVDRVLDGDAHRLRQAVADFVDEAKDADVALVYYSGHGIEAGGGDYLVPTDTDLSTPQTAGQSLLAVDDILRQLARTVPVTIVLLDACRTDSFPAGQMIELPGAPQPVAVAATGLEAVRGPTPVARVGLSPDSLGMVIGFAASPGQPALDGDPDGNSPYAAALLKHFAAGGYSFGDLMTLVSEEVYLKTKAQQLPWVNSSLTRVLQFGKPVEEGDADDRAIKDGRRQLLLSIAQEPQATRATVEAIAGSEGVPLDALYGMLKVLGVDTSGGGADLERQLEEGARQLKTFKEQELGTAATDPELKRLADLASRAQDEGAIELALKYREQATARARVLSSERDTLEAGLKADRIEIAKAFADHGQTAALNFQYDIAAEMFGEAYDQVAKWDDGLALTYKHYEASALRSFGDYKADNGAMQRAIEAFKQALLLAPREQKPAEWNDLSTELGWALETLGERVSDEAALNEAVAVLQVVVDADVPGQLPSDRAVTSLNLGNAVSLLGQRDQDSGRLQQAVTIYEQALIALPRGTDPYNWGKLQYNLASTLRVIGNRDGGTQSLTRSITAFESSIETITRQLSPLEWAQAQNGYAAALVDLGARTHDVTLFNRAVEALNLALEENTEDRVPLAWAMAQTNLGNAYVGLSDEQGDVATLRQGIDAFRASLRQLPPDKVPFYFASAQSNLGTALTTLSARTGDRSLLDEAVAAFKASLELRTLQNDPPDWAMTEFNLSVTLTELGADEVSPAHLHEAIEAASAALTQWSKEQQPVFWAKAHDSLGAAYSALGDKDTTSAPYTTAAGEYALALQAFTKDQMPTEWLRTTKKYAFVLQAAGERDNSAELIQRAADSYREVLTMATREDDAAEFARLNFNLGLCLLNLGAFGAMPDGFVQSATAFRTALTGYDRTGDPEDWADTEYRLGLALHSEANRLGEGGVGELKDALAAYEAAQEVKTKAADPFGWAEIESYLAEASALLGTRSDDRALLQQGRDQLQAAWDVYRTRNASYDADFEQRLKDFDAMLASMDQAGATPRP